MRSAILVYCPAARMTGGLESQTYSVRFRQPSVYSVGTWVNLSGCELSWSACQLPSIHTIMVSSPALPQLIDPMLQSARVKAMSPVLLSSGTGSHTPMPPGPVLLCCPDKVWKSFSQVLPPKRGGVVALLLSGPALLSTVGGKGQRAREDISFFNMATHLSQHILDMNPFYNW